jgi:hypothetical protein
MEKVHTLGKQDCEYAKICPCAHNGSCDGARYNVIGGKRILDYDICIPRIIGQTCCCCADTRGDNVK